MLFRSLKISDIIDEKILNKNCGKFGDKLSGGQKQMVQLIRAYLSDAHIILLDEPTSAIDPIHKKHIVKMIKFLIKNKQVIMVTHDWSLIKNFKRVIKIDNGKIEFDKKINKN